METQFTIAEAIPYIASDPAPEIPTTPINKDPLIDDGAIRRRIRRPLDLARFVVAIALASGTIALGYFATSTTAGLDTDIESGVALLPSLIVLILNVIGGIGSLGLPIAGSINLILRRRFRQLFDALVAMFLAVTALSIASIVMGRGATALMLPAVCARTGAVRIIQLPMPSAMLRNILTK